MDSIKADHGYNMDSRSVRNLLQTMSELDPNQRRDFLKFTTGSPKLPIGGELKTPQTKVPFFYLVSYWVLTRRPRIQITDTDVHRRLQAKRAPIYVG